MNPKNELMYPFCTSLAARWPLEAKHGGVARLLLLQWKPAVNTQR